MPFRSIHGCNVHFDLVCSKRSEHVIPTDRKFAVAVLLKKKYLEESDVQVQKLILIKYFNK
jgi:hypothetical protein